jgi:hypothetical protein
MLPEKIRQLNVSIGDADNAGQLIRSPTPNTRAAPSCKTERWRSNCLREKTKPVHIPAKKNWKTLDNASAVLPNLHAL